MGKVNNMVLRLMQDVRYFPIVRYCPIKLSIFMNTRFIWMACKLYMHHFCSPFQFKLMTYVRPTFKIILKEIKFMATTTIVCHVLLRFLYRPANLMALEINENDFILTSLFQADLLCWWVQRSVLFFTNY